MKTIDIFLTNLLLSIGIWGYVLSCFLIFIESIIPILPLSLFITLLFYKFGILIGFIISYIFTILGCIMSYNIFNSKFKKTFDKFLDKGSKEKIKRMKIKLKNIKFENLCLIIAIPFGPAFMINIVAGLVGLDKRKYIYALLIGKIFLVLFWGLVGTTLISSIKNPINLLYVIIMLVVCFIFSKFVSKKEGL